MTVGAYIQVPFCGQKCTYCNFATGVFSASIFTSYMDAVCREIEMRAGAKELPEEGMVRRAAYGEATGHTVRATAVANAAKLGGAVIDTVYVGGGTPSLLAPRDLARLLDTLRANFDCRFREVTLEADPETITAENSSAWREAGYDRVSLGVQSFADAELLATGRRHRRAEVVKAVENLRRAGFANISMDLIAGLPCQTEESWRQSLAELLAIAPEHVSIYLLETDEGSTLGREMLHGGVRFNARRVPSDDEMASFYEHASEALEGAGYEHYEISNWARRTTNGDGELRSHHNLKYWRREPYLGFGAGAHSFDGEVRQSNTESVTEYLAGMLRAELPVKECEAVGTQQALDEELFLGLRQLAGIDFGRIEKAYGVSLREHIASLAAAGFIEIEGTRARLAPAKLALANEVFVELMGQAIS
jgi:oxygen-independent coproporphyrinogen-3 oxidase